MKLALKQLIEQLDLKVYSQGQGEAEITSGYASDLLSDVLANAGEGCLWVTNQKHQNIVGVTVMVNLAAVIITGGNLPDQNTLEKAKEEQVFLLGTETSMFDIVGRLYELGLRSC